MAFKVKILYVEGLPVDQDEVFEDRAAALDYALPLADSLGQTFSSGERGWPRWVSIYDGDKLDISIQVIRGGLTGIPAQQGLIELPTDARRRD